MSQGTGNQASSCDIFKNQVDPLLAGIVSPTHTAIDDITYTAEHMTFLTSLSDKKRWKRTTKTADQFEV